MNKPTSDDKPKPSSDAGVLPGTPAGQPAKGPGIVPGTPDEKRGEGPRTPTTSGRS
jgi:hypothetical protein